MPDGPSAWTLLIADPPQMRRRLERERLRQADQERGADQLLEPDHPATVTMRRWGARTQAWFDAHLTGMRGLLLAGGLSAALYLMLTLAFQMTVWWRHPDDNLGTIPGQSPWSAPLLALGGPRALNIWMGILTVGVILALFGLQGLALYAARHGVDGKRLRLVVLAFAALFVVILVWMQPITSTDLYGYLARSYLIADLHQNPTINQALTLPGGFQVPKARPPAPYGPLWLLICGAIGWLAGQNLLLAMLLMKSLMALATLGAIALVAWLVDRLLPGQRVPALLFFAWSPLLLLEAVGNGHNDILMMVAVLGSLAALASRRPILAFPLLALGVLIKYSVGALVPLWAVFILFFFCWPRNATQPHLPASWTRPAVRSWLASFDWWRIAWIFGVGGGLSVVLAALCYAPFWVGLKTFTGLGQQLGATYFNGSIAGILFAATSWSVTGSQSASLGSAVRWLLYGAYFVYLFWQVRHLVLRGPQATVTELSRLAGKVIFATLVLVTFWFQPWYIVWLLPLATLAPDAVLRRHAATLAFGGVTTYVVQYFMFVKQQALTRDFFVQFFLVIVAFAPLLILRHEGSRRNLPQQIRAVLGSLSDLMRRRPVLINRVMLGMILVVAALLRLVRLGATTNASALRQVSGALKLSVLDTRGLDGPFAILQTMTVAVLGSSTFALLLPTAIIGTLTVGIIYALTAELFMERFPGSHQTLGLVAALFAATAQWHVALSRSGVQVVLLPLLLTLALWCLWRARHLRMMTEQLEDPAIQRALRRWYTLLLITSGACIGLVADLEPGLWLVPFFFTGLTLALWWLQRPSRMAVADDLAPDDLITRGGRLRKLLQGSRFLQVMIVAGATAVSAVPAIWDYLSRYVGFAPGTAFLARSVPHVHRGGDTSNIFGHFFNELGTVAHIMITQDYGATGPSYGPVPILPALTIPFVFIGLAIVLYHGRQHMESLVVLAMVLLPFLTAVTLGAPPAVVEAATLLPVSCMLPALGLERVAFWIAALPEVMAGPAKSIFISRQNILRVGFLLLLVITTVTTFFWYFVATVPGPMFQAAP